MKFLDLNTGYSFDGLWTENQSKGYIFWFPNEQSTNISYSMSICIISDDKKNLAISIEENDVFDFIKPGIEENINGYIFSSPIYSKSIDVKRKDWTEIDVNGTKKYLYLFNIKACSNKDGEFICKIKIGDEGYIRVGADFYEEDESLYVNLSNMGVEIPDSIQKVIYDSNVHEDYKDNIIVNRKFKELLSNYWDVIANKGSYKSLSNSLKWFEWGENLTVKEIWRRYEGPNSMFSDKEILSIFEDRINESFENKIKTTYISLYYNLFNDTDSYDLEGNPVLDEITLKWSKEDMQLKMSLLAQFFGAFFLPIHISILHATVEDTVYTNTVKAINASLSGRYDYVGDFICINTTIKNNETFKLGNVRAYASKDTLFCVDRSTEIKYGKNLEHRKIAFGVDEFPSKAKIDTALLNDQYYTGPGIIIPIEIEIPNQKTGDYIKRTTVDFNYFKNEYVRLNFYNKIYAKNGKLYIKFNFLAKEAKKYDLQFMFITASSKTYNYNYNFTVEDVDNLVINVYKVKAKNPGKNGFTIEDFLDNSINDHFFKLSKADKKDPNKYVYTQYLPYMDPTNPLFEHYDGIKLSRTVVFDIKNVRGTGSTLNDVDIATIRGFMAGELSDYPFIEFCKYNDDGELTFLIYVSKFFYGDPKSNIDPTIGDPSTGTTETTHWKKYYKNIIRNDLSFYPQFHYLDPMDKSDHKISDYTISQYEAVCCAAEINKGRKHERFKYSHLIDSAHWTFYNPAKDELIENNTAVRIPFIAKETNTMSPGYYDISFKYSLADGTQGECKRDSAFRIKVI